MIAVTYTLAAGALLAFLVIAAVVAYSIWCRATALIDRLLADRERPLSEVEVSLTSRPHQPHCQALGASRNGSTHEDVA